MRILLVQSYLGRREKPIYPLGLAIISSILKNDHDVRVADPNIFPDTLPDLREIARDFQPEITAISLRNVDTTQIADPFVYFNGLEPTIKAVTDVVPDTGVVIGGAGFSIYAREIMEKIPRLDCGVFLEGEKSFPELAAKWPNFAEVKGLFIRRNGRVEYTGNRPFPVMENIPFPDWENVPIEPYKDLLDAVGVQTKRGCALKCAYCNYPFLNGSDYRFQQPERVVDEIERMVVDFGLERFIFVDSVFNLPREHAEAVLREMIRRKLKVKWTGWYNERFLDEDFARLAVEAGCEFFSFSPDGFSDQSLRAVGKNIRKADIMRVFDLMRKFPQTLVGYNFFINPPGQTLGDLLKLFAFNARVRFAFKSRLCGFLLGSIRIEPDTPIFRRAVDESFITDNIPMLVSDCEGLKRLFYRPPNSSALTMMLNLYLGVRRLKRMIKPHTPPPHPEI